MAYELKWIAENPTYRKSLADLMVAYAHNKGKTSGVKLGDNANSVASEQLGHLCWRQSWHLPFGRKWKWEFSEMAFQDKTWQSQEELSWEAWIHECFFRAWGPLWQCDSLAGEYCFEPSPEMDDKEEFKVMVPNTGKYLDKHFRQPLSKEDRGKGSSIQSDPSTRSLWSSTSWAKDRVTGGPQLVWTTNTTQSDRASQSRQTAAFFYRHGKV